MANKRILLIEDDNTLRDAFSMVLSKEFDVVAVADGRLGLYEAESRDFDLILLDMLMPVMDGRAFLRAYDNKKNIPIIVFSNLDAKTEVDEAISLGATRYLLKSWASPKELIKVVRDTLTEV
ncbi:response regulator [Candidatus Saccharibacteria bacterium]|nr:response regulator [Candidatus Saccharibacteria bacterium]NCU40645.1 response regulator [Candidatus Saccharibacteria bacterium]